MALQDFETQNKLMLPHRLILFHRAQEATWKPIPEPSVKLQERLRSHKAQKPTRTPHLNPPLRQQKTWLRQLNTWTPLNIPQNQHRRLPLHPTTGRQQRLSNLPPNLKAWHPLPHKSKRTPNPLTDNHLPLSNRQHQPNHLQKHSWPH